ncbi:MAG: cyanophycin synthetase [Burkholderiaceae bacterium]
MIDDTYNANPDSVRAAIDVLSEASPPRILVLGDMAEVGDQGQAFHHEVGAYAAERGIESLLAFGAASTATVRAFGDGGRHFDDIDDLSLALREMLGSDSSVLVKGSRSMRMERVVTALCGARTQEAH